MPTSATSTTNCAPAPRARSPAPGDAQYSEAKFLQVKHIIERFRGREGQAELDRRWTAKVTDVRNWFTFAASERWREDGHRTRALFRLGRKIRRSEREARLHHPGRQPGLPVRAGMGRGALALVSASWSSTRPSAAARTSLRSTACGCFQQLNLQLLIVTPLQKIHIIEPFVSSVGFVHNEDGRASMLRNLSIDEYREEKARAAP